MVEEEEEEDEDDDNTGSWDNVSVVVVVWNDRNATEWRIGTENDDADDIVVTVVVKALANIGSCRVIIVVVVVVGVVEVLPCSITINFIIHIIISGSSSNLRHQHRRCRQKGDGTGRIVGRALFR